VPAAFREIRGPRRLRRPSSREAAPTGGEGGTGATGASDPRNAAGEASGEEFEITFQPPLPDSLVSVMAGVSGHDAPHTSPPRVVLATGDVIIESLDTDAEELLLLNSSQHAVSLAGWSLFAPGADLWLHLPEGLVVLSGDRVRVWSGPAAEQAGIPPGEFDAGVLVWTTREVWPAPPDRQLDPNGSERPDGNGPAPTPAGPAVILYDGAGQVISEK